MFSLGMLWWQGCLTFLHLPSSLCLAFVLDKQQMCQIVLQRPRSYEKPSTHIRHTLTKTLSVFLFSPRSSHVGWSGTLPPQPAIAVPFAAVGRLAATDRAAAAAGTAGAAEALLRAGKAMQPSPRSLLSPSSESLSQALLSPCLRPYTESLLSPIAFAAFA